MQYFTINKHTDNSEIFSGYYKSFTDCIEDAVKKQTNLTYINLKNQNLTNANLDGAEMAGALLSGANLTGANLSESNLSNAILYNCALYNTCLCYSNLQGCNFSGASFGATLIEGADIQNSIFSTLSCFDLEFRLTENMTGCLFTTIDGAMHKMSNYPIVLKGLINKHIIVLDNAIKISGKIFPRELLPTLINKLATHINQPAINDNRVFISDLLRSEKLA